MRKIVSSCSGAVALDVHAAERAEMCDLAAALDERQRAWQRAGIEIFLLHEPVDVLQTWPRTGRADSGSGHGESSFRSASALRLAHENVHQQRAEHACSDVPVEPRLVADRFEPQRDVFGALPPNSETAIAYGRPTPSARISTGNSSAFTTALIEL